MPDEPSKPLDTDSERDAGGKFAKGNKGGPGRARLPEAVRDMMVAATPKAAQALIAALDASTGEAGEPDHEVRMKAANYIMDRIYGKPTQAVVGEDGGPIRVDMGLLEHLQRLIGG